VDQEESADVARRFAYSPGSFRVLCHQFRHNAEKRSGFFRQPQRGPHSAPARDRVREHAIALRKRNLSVYDIQHALAEAGQGISINALTVLLREEGFARLPRRRARKRLAEIYGRPAPAWRRITLDSLTRTFRTPRVIDERVPLRGYGVVRFRWKDYADRGHTRILALAVDDR
jgi:hypothetical protein